MKRRKMTKEQLKGYIDLRNKIAMYQEQMATTGYTAVSDTVETSSQTIPYSKHVIAVRGYADRARPRLAKKIDKHEKECEAIELFIENVDDPLMSQILARLYIEGQTLEATSRIIGCSKSQIDRKLQSFFDNDAN